jgi:hypothetical protein
MYTILKFQRYVWPEYVTDFKHFPIVLLCFYMLAQDTNDEDTKDFPIHLPRLCWSYYKLYATHPENVLSVDLIFSLKENSRLPCAIQ